MKKKFLALSIMTVMSCMLLLTGCFGKLDTLSYEKASDVALSNTYNVLVTDKNDLTKHGNFTYVNKITEMNFNEEKNIWETTETISTYKRVSQGADTILEITEYEKTNNGLGVTEETTTRHIYTAITSGDTKNYYLLKEYKENNNETIKTKEKTFETESAFVEEVYQKVAKDIMKEICNDFYFGGEKLLYVAVAGAEPTIKGTQDNCTFVLNYNTDSYSSSSYIIERTEFEMSVKIKDAKFDNYKTIINEYENGVKLQSTESVSSLSYSAEIARITSVDNYA